MQVMHVILRARGIDRDATELELWCFQEAAVEIQAAARGKPPRTDLRVKRDAATNIQAAARGKPPRVQLHQTQMAAVAIQSEVRRMLVQRGGAAHATEGGVARHPAIAAALSRALELVQSSSPSYLLLASLDAARWQMASPRADGSARLLSAAQNAAALRGA